MVREIGPIKIGSAIVGFIRLMPQGGYKFVSHSAGHGSSRKTHRTADDAVPAWVKRMEKRRVKATD